MRRAVKYSNNADDFKVLSVDTMCLYANILLLIIIIPLHMQCFL